MRKTRIALLMMNRALPLALVLPCLSISPGCGPTEQEAAWDDATTKLWSLDDKWNELNRRAAEARRKEVGVEAIEKEVQALDQEIDQQLTTALAAAKALPTRPTPPEDEMAELRTQIETYRQRIESVDAERKQVLDARLSQPIPAPGQDMGAGMKADFDVLMKLQTEKFEATMSLDKAQHRLQLLESLYETVK